MTWDNKTHPNKTAKIPYAYKADTDDPLVLIPDLDMVPLVEQAMDYLDEGHSSRRTADWLSEKSGKTISHQGLSNIWKAHRSETSELLKSRKKQRRKNAPKTEAEKRVKAAKRKRSDAKRVLTMAEKKIAKLEGKDASQNSVSDQLDFNAVPQSPAEVGRTSSSTPGIEGKAKFSESQVAKMSDRDYEKNEEAIMEAMRSGAFVYDISGAAR